MIHSSYAERSSGFLSLSLGFCLAVGLSAGGCTGIDVGNPKSLDFALHTTSFAEGASAATVTLTEGWVAIERVRLRPAATCDGDDRIEFTGPFAVDLLARGTVADLSDLELVPDDYCRFELRWHVPDDGFALPAGAPSALAGASIVIAGTRGDGARFILASERNDELRLEAANSDGFTVSEATTALFVAFDGEALFSGVDLAAATTSGGGTDIVIDADNNKDLLDAFEANLRAAMALFDDDDGDGDLDQAERAEGQALAE